MDQSKYFSTVHSPEYLHQVALRESAAAAKLRAKTLSDIEFNHMMTSPEQAQLLAFLIESIGAKTVIEIGVYTGYATLVMAEALPEDGELIACDNHHEWSQIGRAYWCLAGVDHKIKLVIQPALQTLQDLLDERLSESFDFIYIDADKIHYQNYFELCLKLIRPGGIIAFDDMLQVAKIPVASRRNPAARALDDLNHKLHNDQRVSISLLPIGDGLMLARKRED